MSHEADERRTRSPVVEASGTIRAVQNGVGGVVVMKLPEQGVGLPRQDLDLEHSQLLRRAVAGDAEVENLDTAGCRRTLELPLEPSEKEVLEGNAELHQNRVADEGNPIGVRRRPARAFEVAKTGRGCTPFVCRISEYLFSVISNFL